MLESGPRVRVPGQVEQVGGGGVYKLLSDPDQELGYRHLDPIVRTMMAMTMAKAEECLWNFIHRWSFTRGFLCPTGHLALVLPDQHTTGRGHVRYRGHILAPAIQAPGAE